MNIPEIYLVEPYNAYAPKQNKKHWHQVVEEQALLARIHAEQMALMEASSRTLPPDAPQVSTPTIGNPSAGAGGMYPPQVFNPTNGSLSGGTLNDAVNGILLIENSENTSLKSI